LGNPGRKYDQTRHNVGFTTAAKLASMIGAGPSKRQFDGEVFDGSVGSHRMIVLCPLTFMNVSGKSVRKAIDFYKLSPEHLLVICDDLNLPTGKLRIRPAGSAGGQKGLVDIIRHLSTDNFARLKIGIGRPPPEWDVSDYVLGRFREDEQETIESATTRAAHAAIDWASEGTLFTMNKYNADAGGTVDRPKSKP
jgi:PTH1 family peptidyl-tRNA hydrolase